MIAPKRRHLCVILVCAIAGGICVWGISFVWDIGYVHESGSIDLGTGKLVVVWYPRGRPFAVPYRPYIHHSYRRISHRGLIYDQFCPRIFRSKDGTQAVFLYIPVIAAVGLSAVLLFLLRHSTKRSLGASLCGRCRYQLTGNTSGTCPECGTLLTEAQRLLLTKGSFRDYRGHRPSPPQKK